MLYFLIGRPLRREGRRSRTHDRRPGSVTNKPRFAPQTREERRGEVFSY